MNAKPLKKDRAETEPEPKAEDAPAPSPGRFLSLDHIVPSRLNPRRTFEDEGLAELAESIAANGILQNLVVRPFEAAGRGLGITRLVRTGQPMFELVAGERRFRALRLLQHSGRWDGSADNIPAKIIEGDDAEVLALALLENLQREAVNPMEEAEGMAALHRLDPARWSTAEIARRIGKTPRHVQLRLALTDRLTDDTRAALRDGRINLAQARAITGMPAAIQAKTVAAIVAGQTWTARAEDLAAGIFAGLVPASRAIFDPAAAAVEVIEDDDGERWLPKDAFQVAQKAAVEAKVEALAGEWAWAETKSYFFAGGYQDARTEDRSVGGAVVVMDWQGAVQIETGLLKHDTASLGLDKSEDHAARAADRAARQGAMQELQARLWDGLHGDETAALALCAFGLLSRVYGYNEISPTQIVVEDDWTTPRLREAFPELTRFEIDSRRTDGPEDPDEEAGLGFTAEDDQAGLFAELLSWPKAKLAKLIAGIAADSVSVNAFQPAPHPVTAALLGRFAVPLPAFWEPEPADPATTEHEESPS